MQTVGLERGRQRQCRNQTGRRSRSNDVGRGARLPRPALALDAAGGTGSDQAIQCGQTSKASEQQFALVHQLDGYNRPRECAPPETLDRRPAARGDSNVAARPPQQLRQTHGVGENGFGDQNGLVVNVYHGRRLGEPLHRFGCRALSPDQPNIPAGLWPHLSSARASDDPVESHRIKLLTCRSLRFADYAAPASGNGRSMGRSAAGRPPSMHGSGRRRGAPRAMGRNAADVGRSATWTAGGTQRRQGAVCAAGVYASMS